MATGLYTEKMVLVKNINPNVQRKINKLEKFVTFIAIFYVPYYLQASLAIFAPRLDYEFLLSLKELQSKDSSFSKMSEATIESIEKIHHYFLSEELIVLSLCDPNVDCEEKEAISIRITNLGLEKVSENVKLKPTFKADAPKKSLADFVGENSTLLFTLLNLETNFLNEDPKLWEKNEEYKKFENYCQNILVVNDSSERNVQLAQTCILQARDECKIQNVFKIKKNVQGLLPRNKLTKTNLLEYFDESEKS